MFHRALILLLIWICSLEQQPVLASRILFLSPFTAKSHAIFYRSLLQGLVKNNHTIRIVSYDKVLGNDYGNLVQETLFTSEIFDAFPDFLEEKRQRKEHLLGFKLHECGLVTCENFLKSPAVMQVLAEAEENPFDVLITGTLMYECAVPFAHILSIPRILISSASLLPWVEHAVRNPPQWSYYPNIYLPYTNRMNFKERFYNTVFSIALTLHREWVYYPKLDTLIQMYLGEDIPKMSDMDKNLSLVLVNSDPSIDYPKANQPNVIHLGGLHIASSQSLPENLQKFMDESGKDGVILFSMGSVLSGAGFPEEERKIVTQAFQSIPQRVIWKWDLDTPPVDPMPSNILLQKWLPQQAVLAHPKTKAFITHGGLGSSVEAVYHGVPIIGIPVFADQDFNIFRAVHDGSGIHLDLNNLTTSALVDAIHKVTTDQRFQIAMRKRSRILKDKFWDPVELGVYYIEYVIRHQGAPHLRPTASELSWFQLYHIDVFLVMFGLIVALLMLIINILGNIKRCLFQSKRKTKKVKKG
ncbi:UDP-glycosyltransferase UGT5-like [Ischnura elegans]|uniref:UDP-glycosyltransferase UGT5-like n=1 Tax=Ischnura elegans TaxID=197161 RepID=UPI001ED873FF|nr:UDP-glycosyltransferase UGT5-like [Ischnura elegans]